MLTQPKDEPPPTPAPAAPTVTPPSLKQDSPAEYPAQALKDKVRDKVVVELILELDAAGTVKKAQVSEPKGHGFDEVAIAAAQKLLFEPARRNGQPIASKVRHRYEFAPPASRILGRVLTEARDGAVASAQITLTSEAGAATTVGTAPDGSFMAEGLGPGKYRLHVEAEGFTPIDSEETIDVAEEISVTLRLTRINKAAPPPVEPGAPANAVVEEVEVRGVRPPREVTRRTLEQRELSRIPGTNGDALRALQFLPGVARPPGLAGLLIVRGSAPQDTNIFIDGTLVPIVYHFGGISSVVPTEALDRIDFYPGNFSTQYGRVMGGIVDVGLRDPKSKDGKIHGLVQADLIDARALAQGPIGKTGWNFLLAGRRSYVDVWLKPVLEQAGAGVTTAPVYYDYQAILSKDFSSRSNLRLALIGSDDRLEVLIRQVNASQPGLTGGVGLNTGFWRAQAKYRNKISDDTELKAVLAFGQDFIGFTAGSLFFDLTSNPLSSRVELSQKIASGVTMNVGMDWLWAPYKIAVRLPPIPKPGEPPAGPFSTQQPLFVEETGAVYRPAIYDEIELTPAKGTRIVPGVRMDYSKDTKSWDVSPRVLFRQEVNPKGMRTTLKGGVGVFRQPPQPQETNPVFGQLGLSSNRAIHYSLGGEREFTRNIELSTEAFYKQLDNLVTPRAGNSGEGRVYGLEALLRYKPDARFFGWLAYTLSRSERRDTPSEPLRSFQYDQTHILTVLGSYKLGRGWEVGATFRLVSGNMITPNSYGFFDQNVGSYLAQTSYPQFGTRLPAYHQLNIRVDKGWKFQTWSLGAYLDVQNAYNQGNIEGVSYNYNFSQKTFATGIPLLPSLGLRGEL